MKKSTNKPMPFDTGDWLSPRIRLLPPDVRGLLVDLLCLMWESSERGVLLKSNQVPYTREEIVKMLGVDSAGSDAWLDLLIESGFCFVRESDGAYYSRQMLRSEDISAKRREAGRKGGEVTKAKVFAQLPAVTVPEPPVTVQTETSAPPELDLFPPEELPPASPPPLTPEQQARSEKARKYKYADYVTLTSDEYARLCAEYSEEPTKAMIAILNNYKGSKGKRYKSDYLAIKNWVVNRYYEDLERHGIKINGGAVSPVKQTDLSDYQDTL